MIDLSETDVVVTISLTANASDMFSPDAIEALNEIMALMSLIGTISIDKVLAYKKEDEKPASGSGKPEKKEKPKESTKS